MRRRCRLRQDVTLSTSNSRALLTCGTTNQVVVTAPPGKADTTVGR